MPERKRKKKGASGVAASAVATVTAAGVLVGGAYAVKNYAASFKENVIDSNYGANNA